MEPFVDSTAKRCNRRVRHKLEQLSRMKDIICAILGHGILPDDSRLQMQNTVLV